MTLTMESIDTRLRILREAAALFEARGYAGTSMADLSQAVGITKSSLYHHFPSKEALLLEIVQITVDRVTPLVEEIVGSDLPPREKLERALVTHLVEGLADRANLACFLQEGRHLRPEHREAYVAKRDRYEQLFRDILTEGIEAGVFRRVDVALTTRAILGMANSSISWYRPGGVFGPDEIAEAYAALGVRAILDREGGP